MHFEFELEIIDPNSGLRPAILDPEREYPFSKKGKVVEGILLTGQQLEDLLKMRRLILQSNFYLKGGLTPDQLFNWRRVRAV